MSQLLDSLLAMTEDQVAALPDAEQEWIVSTIEREMILRSPAEFALALSGGVWQPYEHLLWTSEAIRTMIDDDDCDVLLVEEPVRHGKTLTCSRWTPAWFICRYRKRVLLTSYEADFAATHGRAARELVAEHGPRFGVEIVDTSRAAARWEIVGEDGGMGTAGAMGPITGKGGHLMIVDDPVKNSEEAQSPAMREKLWEWWQSTFLTRREPGAKVLVIMSRWHEDDLIGRILKQPPGGARVKRLRLPAIAEENDPLGRQPGVALCPERYDEQALAGIRQDVGSNAWASLYQQRPVPLGGGLFKSEMMKQRFVRIVNENGDVFYRLGERVFPEDEVWIFSTMDVAFTRNQRSDFSALATWGVVPTEPISMMLLNVRRERTETAQHAPMLIEAWNTYVPTWIGIEKQNATLGLFSEAQREGIVVRWLEPDKNKFARAETAAALMGVGRIWLPEDADWLPEFIEEVLTFPAGKYDDQVDCLSYAAKELVNRTVHTIRKKHEPKTRQEQMWEKLRQRERANQYHPTIGRFP